MPLFFRSKLQFTLQVCYNDFDFTLIRSELEMGRQGMDGGWLTEDRQLETRIREMAKNGSLSHAMILTGGGDLKAAARFVAMAMQCGESEPPCGSCPACRKTAEDIHPDVITVRDPEHKNISMEILREIRADAYVLPNEGRRKVYIFPDCDVFEQKTQNVFLKVLEEGPPQAAFLLCAPNLGQLLPTIRSRCVVWQVSGGGEVPAEDSRAEELWRLLARRDKVGVVTLCTHLEQSKVGREELQQLVGQARDRLAEALASGYTGLPGEESLRALGKRRLMALADVLGEAQRQLRYNLGVGHVCGALAVELAALL